MGCRSGPWQGAWGNGGNTGDRPGRTRWVRCCCLEKFEFLIGRAQLTAGKGGEAAAQTTGRSVPIQPGAWKWRAEVLARRGTVLREGDVDSEVWVSQHSGGASKVLIPSGWAWRGRRPGHRSTEGCGFRERPGQAQLLLQTLGGGGWHALEWDSPNCPDHPDTSSTRLAAISLLALKLI